MSKFFRFLRREPATRPPPSRPLNRALIFAAALVCLWVALQLLPRSSVPTTGATVFSDEAGTVLKKMPPPPAHDATGYVLVVLILAAGGALALFLRRRVRPQAPGTAALHTLSHLSMGPNQQLRLVACGGDVLLLGITSGQITLLKSYPGDAFTPASETPPSETSISEVPAPMAAAPFAAVLNRYAGSFLNAEQPVTP